MPSPPRPSAPLARAAGALVAGWLGLGSLITVSAGGTVSPAPPPPPVVSFAGLAPTADVQPKNPDRTDHPVRARLLVDKASVEPGGTVRVGLHLTQRKGWHTYWKSPGDIGLPTAITWTLPAGATAAPYQYPVPQRFEDEGMVSFGYDKEVLLFTEVTVPTGLSEGTVQIGASAEWLVCESSCIPGAATLSGPLVIGAASTPSAYAPLFDHYAAQHPLRPEQLPAHDVRMVLSADAVLPFSPFSAVLEVKGPGRVQPDATRYAFAPIVGDGWMVTKRSVGHVGDALVARIDGETLLDAPPASDRVGGLFLLQVDGRPVALEVEQPLPWRSKGEAVVPGSDPLLKTPIDAVPDAPAAHPPSDGDHGSVAPVSMASLEASGASAASGAGFGTLGNLLFAFLGGLLLNVMPCVLPVLTLKLYSLVEQTDITPSEQRAAGVAYTLGILVSFVALALAIVGIRTATGSEVDWGFQFQYPPYVAALATVVFAFGLSLFGVFEIPAMGVSSASEQTAREGLAGYFATGVFATLLATPCSAPFLGTAVAFALGAPTWMLLAIFSLIGLGLAAPFLLIAFVPALYRLLPRPGSWMETFKQGLGFTLIATTVWLVGVLGAQIGLDRVLGFVAFLGFVAAGCWVFGHFGGVMASSGRQAVAAGAGLLVSALGGALFLDLQFAEAAVCDDGSVTAASDLDFADGIPWQPFSEARVEALAGTPVFVDFTAEWCLTCKVNEKTVLETSTVRDAMARHGVVPLKADWTRRDEAITRWLHRYGKAGVPFYLVVPAQGDPIPLGEVITPGMVVEALARSGG